MTWGYRAWRSLAQERSRGECSAASPEKGVSRSSSGIPCSAVSWTRGMRSSLNRGDTENGSSVLIVVRDAVEYGTISRHIICSGQLFAQFFRGHPEELPEAQRGQLQAQEAVRRLILSVPGPELV